MELTVGNKVQVKSRNQFYGKYSTVTHISRNKIVLNIRGHGDATLKRTDKFVIVPKDEAETDDNFDANATRLSNKRHRKYNQTQPAWRA